MKNKFLFIILLAFIFVGVVNADTTSPTGVSGDSFRVSAEIVSGSKGPSLQMKVTAGIPDSSEVELAYALFSTSATGATTYPGGTIETDNNDFTKYKTVNVMGIGVDKIITVSNSWLVTNYDYVNIFYKKTDGTYYYTNSAVHIERPNLRVNNSKYTIIFSSSEKKMNIVPNFPYVELAEGEEIPPVPILDVKMAPVELFENTITPDALLEYAEGNTVFQQLESNGGAGLVDYSSVTIEKDKLYYIYVSFKNSNSLSYYHTEEAILAVGSDNGLLALANGQHGAVDPGDDPQPDQPDQPGEPDGPIENPYTGLSVGIVGMLLFAAGMVILLVTNKRKMYKI